MQSDCVLKIVRLRKIQYFCKNNCATMNKLLKTISLTCLFIFMAVSFSGCDDNDIESENFYLPVLSGTTWHGEVVYNVDKTASFDVEYLSSLKCEIKFDNSEDAAFYQYMVSGRILQFLSISEGSAVPESIKGAWTLVKQEPGKLYLEGVPDINNVKASLVLKRKQ